MDGISSIDDGSEVAPSWNDYVDMLTLARTMPRGLGGPDGRPAWTDAVVAWRIRPPGLAHHIVGWRNDLIWREAALPEGLQIWIWPLIGTRSAP